MNITTKKKELRGPTIYDTDSRIRNDFLKNWFPNSVDCIRYYMWFGGKSSMPVIGKLVGKAFHLYARYIHTNSIVLPLPDIEEILRNAVDIFVDPCPCRLIAGDLGQTCDSPLFTCMRINNSAKVRKEQKKKATPAWIKRLRLRKTQTNTALSCLWSLVYSPIKIISACAARIVVFPSGRDV